MVIFERLIDVLTATAHEPVVLVEAARVVDQKDEVPVLVLEGGHEARQVREERALSCSPGPSKRPRVAAIVADTPSSHRYN